MAKKNKRIDVDNYFKVVTNEKSDSAEIFLYGVIGQDFWWSEKLQEESLTDLEFVKALRRLEEKYSVINIRINSPGGSMYHGNAIISAIRNSKAEIHGWNDGLAASMAGDIWIACKHRHMAKNALLMIHSALNIVWGNAKEMRTAADLLDKWTFTAIAITAEAMGKTEEEVKALFYDYEDHWFTAPEVKDLGLITQADEYESEGVIPEASKMSFQDIIKRFADDGDEVAKNWLNNLNKLSQQATAAISNFANHSIANNQTTNDMKIEDLKKSLEENEISQEQLAGVLKELGLEVKAISGTEEPKPGETDEPAGEAGADAQAAAITAAIEKATKPLTEKIEKLEADLKEMGDQPGANRTDVSATADPGKIDADKVAAKKQLDEVNEQIAKAGENGGIVKFVTK